MAFQDLLDDFIKGATTDTATARAVEYVRGALEQGRPLNEILEDPYIKTKVPEGVRQQLLSHPDILKASRSSVLNTFDCVNKETQQDS